LLTLYPSFQRFLALFFTDAYFGSVWGVFDWHVDFGMISEHF